ncbi:lipopolysaccharide transport periplasmic protein LptA [Paracoccus seriniphilus]|uniref:Lipopolysaccharide export system protein LptA n=1 Tax=Paracoccus seriniphilus TaxID=184748 RepID=A0A239PMM2_9RHOB|nr:lipopolysaccharide transport periplasmic protein LptA [Paracoccus seriniphilus]WCR13761.1 lipopolysaccharide transport periplasmic protein LptA [Paracoccus seriniphilus]SNT68629.1 lipopolysaccharide export system protein LptA [Paracoccus seriniphilus]
MLRPLMIALLLASGPAFAQSVAFGGMQADSSAPVEVAADRLEVDQADGNAVFTGNVVIGQGEMRLSADRVTVEYANEEQSRIRSMHAVGNVVLVSGGDAAEAREAVYQVETGGVTLTGDVVLAQGESVLTGDKMIVDLVNGTARVDGRVRSILQQGGN